MQVTMEDVLAALTPEEPGYAAAAARLGAEALPHLAALVRGPDPMLAAKAAYLAGVIGGPGGATVLEEAALAEDPTIRVAAAASVQHLPPPAASNALARLLDDHDMGVRKAALRSVRSGSSAAVRQKVLSLSQDEWSPHLRELAESVRQKM